MADNLDEWEREEPTFGLPIWDDETVSPSEASRNLEAISRHVEQYIGPVKSVFHELVSRTIHLDVMVVPPTAQRPFYTLVTSGVGDLPMDTPPGREDFNRAELLILLPSEWPLEEKDFKKAENYWPVHYLRMIGHFPHEYNIWISWFHTIDEPDEEPIENTPFTGLILFPPLCFSSDFAQLHCPNGDIITFCLMFPLYPEELKYSMKHGPLALMNRLEKHNVSWVVDPSRPPVVKRRGSLGR